MKTGKGKFKILSYYSRLSLEIENRTFFKLINSEIDIDS